MLKVPTDVVVVLAKIVDHSVNEDIKLAMEATQGAVLRCDVKRYKLSTRQYSLP
jgi:hypothetical protein